jgi:TonB family protein
MKTATLLALVILTLSDASGLAADVSKEKIFWTADQRTSVKIMSSDRLELSTERGTQTCEYSRNGDTLRVVATSLGSVEVLYLTITAEGLVSSDGVTFYDDHHLKEASRLSHQPTSAVSAPRPEYPYEARVKRITGHGVVLLTIDVQTGNVTDAIMAESTGSPILDNAAVSAFRRWRFKPRATGATVSHPNHLYDDRRLIFDACCATVIPMRDNTRRL